MASILGVLRAVRRFGRRQRATAEPGQLAFAALAADPGLLGRLPRDQARRLGEQAGGVARSLLRTEPRRRSETHARDAATTVLRSVGQFAARDAVVGPVEDMIASARSGASTGLGGLLATIAAEMPRLGLTSAGLSMDAVRALGASGLRRLDRDAAELLMMAAACGTARRLREDPLEPVDAGLPVVETVCMGWGVLPLRGRLRGSRRDWAEQLVELWRDAGVLADRREAGPARRLWEDARDGHAFGAVWMMPAIVSVLLPAESERLARDARSAAGFVLRRGARPGVRAAVEAARSVLVSCGVTAASGGPDSGEPASGGPVRRSVVQARVFHA